MATKTFDVVGGQLVADAVRLEYVVIHNESPLRYEFIFCEGVKQGDGTVKKLASLSTKTLAGTMAALTAAEGTLNASKVALTKLNTTLTTAIADLLAAIEKGTLG